MEILVVDDASTDSTGELARQMATTSPVPITVVAGPGRGVAAARNAGAARAEGRVLLFTDADCRPEPDWAAALVAAVVQTGVSAATGRQRSRQTELVARLVQAEYDEKHARLAQSARVSFGDTATVAYRTEQFRAIGGFDERLHNFEDTELAFRMAEAGYRFVLVPDAVVWHRHVTSLAAYARRKLRIGYWGASVYRAHIRKVADDSRTPWAMRAQLVLAPVMTASVVAGPFVARAWILAAVASLAFLISAVPYARICRRQGLDALLAAPALLLVRALALDGGMLAGFSRLAAERTRQSAAAHSAALAAPTREGNG